MPSTGTVIPVTNAAFLSSMSQLTQPKSSDASPKRFIVVCLMMFAPRENEPESVANAQLSAGLSVYKTVFGSPPP